MAQTVYKYALPLLDSVSLALPAGAKILDVQAQNGAPCMWALVDPDAPVETRRFHVRGTGHDATGVGPHVASFQMHGGALVFHVFEAA